MRAANGYLSQLASRDALVTLAGLLAVTVISWWYIAEMAAGMSAMAPGMMLKPWTASYFIMMFAMWSIMMVAMMIPSAAPMVLLYRLVANKNRLARPGLGTALFAAGYLVVWSLFSVMATLLQWMLEEWALLSPMMRSQSVLFSGITLIAAGLYQWSSLKQACLRHCRGALFFISQHWRPGSAGAFQMGLTHGMYCVGCCGALMALLFVGGIMDLTVIAAIAVIVLLEKLMPGGEWLARLLGAAAIVLGGVVIVSGVM